MRLAWHRYLSPACCNALFTMLLQHIMLQMPIVDEGMVNGRPLQRDLHAALLTAVIHAPTSHADIVPVYTLYIPLLLSAGAIC